MDPLLLGMCISTAVLCFLIFCWHLCSRRYPNRNPPDRTLVISECFLPQLVWKSVPCQHPYYRVISEYSKKSRPPMPDIKEDLKESGSCEELDVHAVQPPDAERQLDNDRKFSHIEWSRRFSLTSIPRRSSLSSSPYRKLSNCSSVGSSRRSSDANSPLPLSPIYKTKPTLLIQSDPCCKL